MLAYLLALTVGLGSFALYMAAFFFPEVHRKNDFIWSGVGLFYALVLWVCAARITGGVLLGQTASVTLLGWLGWQTLLLRRQVAPLEQQTAVPTSEEVKATVANLASPETVSKLTAQVSQQAAKLKTWGQAKLNSAKQSAGKASETATASEPPYVPLTPADFASIDRSTVSEVSIADSTPAIEHAPEPAKISQSASIPRPDPPAQPVVEKSSDPKSPIKPTGGFGGAIQQMLSGANKKRDKPVYVRKQFRDPDPAEPIAATLKADPPEAEAAISAKVAEPAAAEAIVEDSDMPSDAILESEIAYESDGSNSAEAPTLQATPPHPPAPELVEAALIDAEEKHLPASPPAAEPDIAESQESEQ